MSRKWVKLWCDKGSLAKLPFYTRACASELLTKCDDDGRIELGGKTPAQAVAWYFGANQADRVKLATDLKLLEAAGYLHIDGDFLVVTNFTKWQGDHTKTLPRRGGDKAETTKRPARDVSETSQRPDGDLTETSQRHSPKLMKSLDSYSTDKEKEEEKDKTKKSSSSSYASDDEPISRPDILAQKAYADAVDRSGGISMNLGSFSLEFRAVGEAVSKLCETTDERRAMLGDWAAAYIEARNDPSPKFWPGWLNQKLAKSKTVKPTNGRQAWMAIPPEDDPRAVGSALLADDDPLVLEVARLERERDEKMRRRA